MVDRDAPTNEQPDARDRSTKADGRKYDPKIVVVRESFNPIRRAFWAAVALVTAAVFVAGLQLINVIPDFGNPFSEERENRTQQPLLVSIQGLSRYVAAEGSYQVVVDLQESRENIPEVLINQRTLFVGVGTVEAYVDFSSIDEDAVVESASRRNAEITLPKPQLTDVDLNAEESYVVAEQRGIVNRLHELFGGNSEQQEQVYVEAEEAVAAAAADSALVRLAEDNTRSMLEGMLRSLGYEDVTVTFSRR
jgi:hypothetical protein